MQYQGENPELIQRTCCKAHPSPPVHPCPQVSQLVVSEGLYHVVRGAQLEARHHYIPIFLG